MGQVAATPSRCLAHNVADTGIPALRSNRNGPGSRTSTEPLADVEQTPACHSWQGSPTTSDGWRFVLQEKGRVLENEAETVRENLQWGKSATTPAFVVCFFRLAYNFPKYQALVAASSWVLQGCAVSCQKKQGDRAILLLNTLSGGTLQTTMSKGLFKGERN